MLHKTFSHIYTQILALLRPLLFPLFLMPSHHAPIPIISSKKPQDINLPYVSFRFIKKNLSFPSVLRRTLLLNHLMVKQWSAIFSSPQAGRPWPLPSYRCVCVCVLKLLCQLGASVLFNRLHMSRRYFRSIKDINPQVGCWWYWEIGCLCVQVDDCCYNKATIASKGSMGNRRAFREGYVYVCL